MKFGHSRDVREDGHFFVVDELAEWQTGDRRVIAIGHAEKDWNRSLLKCL